MGHRVNPENTVIGEIRTGLILNKVNGQIHREVIREGS